MRTALSIIQSVAGEVGLTVPTIALASTDGMVVQLRSLFVAACDELADEYNWPGLTKTAIIATVPGQSEYTLPADMLRELPMTQWDTSGNWRQRGSLEPSVWAAQQSINSAANNNFRVLGSKLQLLPAPAAAFNFQFQYVSNNYFVDSGTGSTKNQLQNDGDMTVFHDRALTNLLKLKILQAKGMETVDAVDDYYQALESAKGGGSPAPVLYMGGPREVLWADSTVAMDGDNHIPT